ncbi:uncharacterized protein At1g28695-like [Vicia villosa]|uniref:uncharacterized protein At1g28695-like n=1 Tax=Vicia villosa TaxID=3911 RepID=UPI00273CAD6A|nr:uncharacterized protein At1g28695-like [Vicia villosa]
MRIFRTRKCVYVLPLTAFLIVLIMFFLQHHNLETVTTTQTKYDPEKQELIQVLKKAAMEDRTVILTMVDESHARPGSMLEVFLQSFEYGHGTRRFLNHLVIITMDQQAFRYCRLLHQHCIHPATFQPYFSARRPSVTSPDHTVLFSWRRNHVLIQVIELGYNIIFTETDVLWLKSPLVNFHPQYELSISCNFVNVGEGAFSVQEGGIFFMKANYVTPGFLQDWKLTKILHPNSTVDESMCATLELHKDLVDINGVRVHRIDTNHFGGFCQTYNDMLEDAYTIHANCCYDLESKVHDLKIVLDDWIRFRNRVSKSNATEKIALRWPQKCTEHTALEFS